MRLESMSNSQLAEYLGNEERALLRAEADANWHRMRADNARSMLFARLAGTERVVDLPNGHGRVWSQSLKTRQGELPIEHQP